MANYIIPSSNTEYDIADDDSTYTLETDSVLNVNGAYGIFGGPGYTNDKVMVQGDILQSGAGFVAVNLAGDDMYSKVFAGSLVSGFGGYQLNGDDATLFNKGSIRGTDAAGVGYYGISALITNGTGAKIFGETTFGSGIDAFGANGVINNNGKISAFWGIHNYNANTTINILDQGSVKGTGAAIYSDTNETARRLVVHNDGVIDGGTAYAIQTADGKDSIYNTGKIIGTIDLGSGKDLFDNRGGTIDNGVYGGTGDDTLITDNNKTKLFENGGSAGFDTVRASSNYYLSQNVEKLVLFGNKDISGQGTDDGNELYGNAHKNKLFGLDGADILDGGKGADKMQGGEGPDTFVFKTGYGVDTVFDYEHSEGDKLDLSDWAAITSFNDLINNHATEENGSVYLKAGNDWLVLKSTTIDDLDSTYIMI